MEENLPPGFRFHPTDEELITYYLTRKVLDFGFIAKAIANVDLNKCEPWDLPGKASMGEKEWYFFSLRDRKYPTGLRTNRATDAGYWKTTGKDKEIFHSTVLVGMKKTLVFYKGRAPKGEKTSWVMHEYRLQNKFPYKPTKEEWVVCRIFKKSSNGKKPQPNTSSLESPCNTTSVTELGELDASIMNINLVNPTSGSFTSMQTNESSNNNNINNNNMNLYMNWMLTREASSQPLLPWLGSSFSTNPSVLKALTFNGYQEMETANISSLNSFLGQGSGDHAMYGTDTKSIFHASSSRGTDSLQQQPQHDHESIWRGY